MHEKVLSGDLLQMRGCILAYIYNIFKSSLETIDHVFFFCPYATRLLKWLSTTLKASGPIMSKKDIWSLCKKRKSPQGLLVIRATILFIIVAIEQVRNYLGFSKQVYSYPHFHFQHSRSHKNDWKTLFPLLFKFHD